MTEPIATNALAEADTPPASIKARANIRVIELDLLRFIAASAVMFYHYTYRLIVTGATAPSFPSIGRATLHGYLGVHLFFMISGFVILWTARDRRPAEFVVSRVARLYPEFWVAVIVSAIAFTATGFHRVTLPMVAANLTMVPQLFRQQYVDGVYWTLSNELKFYLLLWILSLCRQMPRIERWIYVWLGVTIACFVADMPQVVRSIAIYPFGPLFIAGALFYLVRIDGWDWARAIGVSMCAVLAMIDGVRGMSGFVVTPDIVRATQVETMLLILLFFLAFVVIVGRRKRTMPFAGIITFLGMLTYPLYLLHNVGKAAVELPLARYSESLAAAAAIVFSLGVSALTVSIVEFRWRKPFTVWLSGLLVRGLACFRSAEVR